MDSCFIDDGMTRDGFVSRKPGLHAALAFRFRPALAEERYEFSRKSQGDGAAYARLAAALVNEHVLDWEAKNKKGDAVPKTEENIRRLHPTLLNAVLDQVLGYAAADERAAEKN